MGKGNADDRHAGDSRPKDKKGRARGKHHNRVDQIEIARRVESVRRAIIEGYSTADLIAYSTATWGMDKRQTARYIKAALKALAETSSRDRDLELSKAVERNDMLIKRHLAPERDAAEQRVRLEELRKDLSKAIAAADAGKVDLNKAITAADAGKVDVTTTDLNDALYKVDVITTDIKDALSLLNDALEKQRNAAVGNPFVVLRANRHNAKLMGLEAPTRIAPVKPNGDPLPNIPGGNFIVLVQEVAE